MIKHAAVFVAALGLAAPTAAFACSCMPTSVETAWNGGGDLVTVHVTGSKTRGGMRYFLGEVSGVYQGCSADREMVVLSTNKSGAACGGAILGVGSEYLVETYPTGRVIKGLYRELSYNLCGVNKVVDTVTPDEWDFLNSRWVSCPTTGEGYCVMDDLWECFVDPCEVAPECPDGECVSNYCGACDAEFYDWFGAPVCTDL
jgi:hypothetical protein